MEKIEKEEVQIKKMVPCAICHNEFTTKYHLEAHEIAVHQEVKFKCDICEVNFTTKGALTYHNTIHKENAPNYHCKTCDKSFALKSYLTAHYKSHLTQIHENPDFV